MKFTIFAAATLAVTGLASAAVHPAEHCTRLLTATESTACQEFADSIGLAPQTFAILNHGIDINDKDCKVSKGEQYCVAAPRTKAKRCLAEKKKAAAKSAAAKSAAAATPAAKDTAPVTKATVPKASSSSNAPSQYAIPKSETAGLRLVNKINPNCQWFYTILDTDVSCSDVAAKNNINESVLYSLNKNLHSREPNTCDNLDTGKTYCVGL